MRFRLAVALTIAAVAGIATAALAVTGGPAPARNALTVTLDEWSLTPSHTSVAAGRTRIVRENTGRFEHELLIVRTNTPADELPIGLEGVRPSLAGKLVFGAEHSHHAGGEADAGNMRPPERHLAPGESRPATVTLRPGRYVLLCSLPGHYEAGQRATLEVG